LAGYGHHVRGLSESHDARWRPRAPPSPQSRAWTRCPELPARPLARASSAAAAGTGQQGREAAPGAQEGEGRSPIPSAARGQKLAQRSHPHTNSSTMARWSLSERFHASQPLPRAASGLAGQYRVPRTRETVARPPDPPPQDPQEGRGRDVRTPSCDVLPTRGI
jgi:hypothetical protein